MFVLHRQFITSHYPTMKQANPDLPILIRQAQGTPARVFARFGAYSASHSPLVLIGLPCREGAGKERGGRGPVVCRRRVTDSTAVGHGVSACVVVSDCCQWSSAFCFRANFVLVSCSNKVCMIYHICVSSFYREDVACTKALSRAEE